MKTASKVFIVLSIASAAISVVVMLLLAIFVDRIFAASIDPSEVDPINYDALVNTMRTLYIIGIFSSFVPIIVGGIALRKLSVAQSHDDLVAIGIITLILCSLIGGILMLCIKDEDLNPYYYYEYEEDTDEDVNKEDNNTKSF